LTRPLPVLIALAFVLSLVPGLAAFGEPPSVTAGSPPAAPAPALTPNARWEARLDEALLRVRKAEARRTRALSAWKHARHRQKPRGDALDELRTDLHEAEQELAFAREDLPRLREMARRDGVQPVVLRRTE
jgi:hypothetical protein